MERSEEPDPGQYAAITDNDWQLFRPGMIEPIVSPLTETLPYWR